MIYDATIYSSVTVYFDAIRSPLIRGISGAFLASQAAEMLLHNLDPRRNARMSVK